MTTDQSARDAAADYEYASKAYPSPHDKDLERAMREGRLDHWSIVQAFQRAIDAAKAQQREADARALEAIEVPVDGLGDKVSAWLKAINIGAAAIREGSET